MGRKDCHNPNIIFYRGTSYRRVTVFITTNKGEVSTLGSNLTFKSNAVLFTEV